MKKKPPTFPDAKDPRETVTLTFDATPALASGETLTSVTATQISGLDGGDILAPILVLATPQVNTAALTFQETLQCPAKTIAIGCGVQAVATVGGYGSKYLIELTCPTSNPNKVLVLKGILEMADV